MNLSSERMPDWDIGSPCSRPSPISVHPRAAVMESMPPRRKPPIIYSNATSSTRIAHQSDGGLVWSRVRSA